ncbi:MAG: hypothetical protein R2784_20945 [Saprospiraceae bacterium]
MEIVLGLSEYLKMNKSIVMNSNSIILKSSAVFFFLIFCYTGIAQVNFQIKQKCQSDGTNIFIRWAPLDFSSFYFGQDNGYRVFRTTLRQADTLLSGYQMYQSKVILDSMILPMAEMDWEAMADTNDMAGIAAMALYGEEVEVLSVDSVSFIEVANLNSQDESKFGFGLFAADQSFDIALKMGLGFVDTTVVSGGEYSYTVIPNNIDSTMSFKPSPSIVSVKDTFFLPKIDGVLGYGGDSVGYLSWNNPKLNSPFSSFMVERSSDGGSTFVQVSDKPILFTSNGDDNPGVIQFADFLPNNDSVFIYRILGKSAFGIYSPPSDTIHIKGKPATLSESARSIGVAPSTNNGLEITWEFPSNMESMISGFNILRAENRDAQFLPINSGLVSPGSRIFEDTDPQSLNYYRVDVVDLDGNYLPSDMH